MLGIIIFFKYTSAFLFLSRDILSNDNVFDILLFPITPLFTRKKAHPVQP